MDSNLDRLEFKGRGSAKVRYKRKHSNLDRLEFKDLVITKMIGKC